MSVIYILVNMCNKTNRDGYRVCIACKIEKPLTRDYFYADKNRLCGYMYRCKSCDKGRKDKRVLRWRNMTDAQKARANANNRKYSSTPVGKASVTWYAYRAFDMKKGLVFSVTKADVANAQLSLCTYCGFPATGFDRINNSVGHTKENCVPSCTECNVARMDNFTHEEMILIGDAIRLIKSDREYTVFGNCVL